MNFHVGQKVVCVDDGSGPSRLHGWGSKWDDGEAILRGEVYTISRQLVDDDGDLILHLLEVSRSPRVRAWYGEDAGYAAVRFRPVKTTSIDVFHQMLAPDAPQRADYEHQFRERAAQSRERQRHA